MVLKRIDNLICINSLFVYFEQWGFVGSRQMVSTVPPGQGQLRVLAQPPSELLYLDMRLTVPLRVPEIQTIMCLTTHFC